MVGQAFWRTKGEMQFPLSRRCRSCAWVFKNERECLLEAGTWIPQQLGVKLKDIRGEIVVHCGAPGQAKRRIDQTNGTRLYWTQSGPVMLAQSCGVVSYLAVSSKWSPLVSYNWEATNV